MNYHLALFLFFLSFLKLNSAESSARALQEDGQTAFWSGTELDAITTPDTCKAAVADASKKDTLVGECSTALATCIKEEKCTEKGCSEKTLANVFNVKVCVPADLSTTLDANTEKLKNYKTVIDALVEKVTVQNCAATALADCDTANVKVDDATVTCKKCAYTNKAMGDGICLDAGDMNADNCKYINAVGDKITEIYDAKSSDELQKLFPDLTITGGTTSAALGGLFVFGAMLLQALLVFSLF